MHGIEQRRVGLRLCSHIGVDASQLLGPKPRLDGRVLPCGVTKFRKEYRLLKALRQLHHLLPNPLAARRKLLELFEACPRLTLLVTSREPLGIQQETRIEVDGLACPLVEDERPERYDAVRLFTERARLAEPHFKVAGDDREAVANIVRLLAGLPLAIELAAAWVGRLTPSEIAVDLETNLDAIERESPEVLKRHRGLRSVFEHSWRLLSDLERDALAKLAVFRGGCSREAAQVVCAATLRTLLALVAKSLLRRTADGRFEMLEAVRQYAAEKLKDDGAVRDEHSSYYSGFLEVRQGELTGAEQVQALAEVSDELDNVRSAWRWAVERRRTEDIERSVEPLSRYYDMKALNAEAVELFGAAAEALESDADEATGITRVRLLLRQGVFMNRLARFDEARRLLTEGLNLLEGGDLDEPREQAFGHCALGAVAYKESDNLRSREQFARALELYQGEDDGRGIAMALDGLGSAAFARGDHAEAEEHYRRSLAVATEHEDHYWMLRGYKNVGMACALLGNYPEARKMLGRAVTDSRAADDRSVLAGSLNNLGRVQHILGDHEASESSLRECLELHRDAGNRWGQALVSSNLGALRYEQQDFEGARMLHLAALTAFEEIENRSGMSLALARLGAIALEEGNDPTARGYFLKGLELAEATGETARTLELLGGLATITLREGEVTEAVRLLSLVVSHPSSEPVTITVAEEQLAAARGKLPTASFADAKANGAAQDLHQAVRELQ